MSDTVANKTLVCEEFREEEELDESMEELRVYEDEDEYCLNPKDDGLQNYAVSIATEEILSMELGDGKENAAKVAATNVLNNNLESYVVQRGHNISEGMFNTEKTLQPRADENEDIVKSKKKRCALIDSESESDTEIKGKTPLDDEEVEDEQGVALSRLSKNHTKSSVSSSDEDGPTQHEDVNTKMKSRLSNLVDSDSVSELSGEEDMGQKISFSTEDCADGENRKKSRTKHMRASAKKALDEMQAIQSEQQRLHREAHISIPYHKPKKYTLQDFLKRRTIIKPQEQNEDNSPIATLKTKSLKMTPTELEEYANLMEARAMEATEFFKSEDEERLEESTLKSEASVLPQETIAENENDKCSKVANEMEALIMDDEVAAVVKGEANESITTSKPKVIITEVIELPKLDLSTFAITPPKDDIPKRKENLKLLITKNNLPDSPSLQGDPNMLIDLDTGDLVAKKPTGVDNLLQRLMSTNKTRKAKSVETVNILSTENGKLEMSKVNVHIVDESDASRNHKPREAYFKLKENLKSIITKKRVEEMHKRQEEENEHKKCLEDYDVNAEDEVSDDEDTESEANLTNVEQNFVDIVIDDEENACNFNDNEDSDDATSNENEDEENEEEDKDEYDAEDVGCKENGNDKPKTRILQVFADDSDDEIDLLQTPAQVDNSNIVPVFEEQLPQNSAKDEQELLALCSGQFETTQRTVAPLISQIPITQMSTERNNSEELLRLCSGSFEENIEIGRVISAPKRVTQNSSNAQTVPTVQLAYNKILSSDEYSADKAKHNNRSKKFTKKIKKSKIKLGFSDDEDEEEDDTIDLKLLEITEDAPEVPVSYVDYDSEENEIVVEMTKEDCVKQAGKFFEQEAELSESEWGSADEDEEHMDKYDIELGDEDEFDRDKLQTELGRIHARKMLDEDIREVRKIQEMLFEDAEADGVGRQRQFKWKNAESTFNLDDTNRQELNEPGESGDEENEQLWRKIRFEREQLLREQGLKNNLTGSTVVNANYSSTSATGVAVKKMNIITSITRSSIGEKKSPFLISKNTTAMQQKKKVRDSFLMRDKETLTKLAGLTKGGSGISEEAGTTSTVLVKAIKPKNFVFATLTEEEHESKKRKADDLMNSSSENGINYIKKPKVGPRRDACLIDQLL